MPKLTVKCSDAELVVWKESAWEARVTLSEWVRRALADRAANGGGPMATAMRGLTEEQLGRGLVAGDEGGVVAENQTSDGRAQKSAVGDSRTPSEQSSPAASRCKREHLHHTNHGGKPCGECGWPNV